MPAVLQLDFMEAVRMRLMLTAVLLVAIAVIAGAVLAVTVSRRRDARARRWLDERAAERVASPTHRRGNRR
ncbi:MAG: hypothetical protein ACRDZO_12315 [Egibacteraceae bacterium]